MRAHKYEDVVVSVSGGIGTIKFSRTKSPNAFGGNLMLDVVAGIRELNAHPKTLFTVITGDGRYFSAGADMREHRSDLTAGNSDAEKKISFMQRYTLAVEMLRSMIDHKKVLVVALNGPTIGGGAAWFPGVDPAAEMEDWGLASQVFPASSFQRDVQNYLQDKLYVNDGKSMMEAKRLMGAPLWDGRIVAVQNAMDALAERFVEGAPYERFAQKRKEIEAKGKKPAKL